MIAAPPPGPVPTGTEPGAAAGPGMAARAVEAIAATLLTLSALVALLQVFFRYGLDNSLSWPEELAQWMFVWAVFLGAAALVAGKGHIAIETFSAGLAPAGRQRHRALVDGCAATAAMILLVEGLSFVAKSTYVSPGLQWPFKLLYAAVPAGGALILMFLVLRRSREWGLAWRNWTPLLAGGVVYVGWLYAAPHLPAGNAAWVLMAVAAVMIALEVPIAFAFVLGTFAAFSAQGDLMLVTIPCRCLRASPSPPKSATCTTSLAESGPPAWSTR
jgi:C4-dicarboxylate transporter DctM subunit